MTKPWSRALREKAKHSGAAETIGTIAFYGPDRSYASKVAVGVSPTAALQWISSNAGLTEGSTFVLIRRLEPR